MFNKVVLLGPSSVGKTSLLQRFIMGIWDPEAKPTIGAVNQIKTMKIDEEDVDVFIWDTAGQERFRSLIPSYVRGAQAAIIVVSYDKPQSFSEIQEWKKFINEFSPGIPVILAINKTDLNINIEGKYDLSDFYKVVRCSAKDGSCVDALFIDAATAGYRHMRAHSKHLSPIECRRYSEAIDTPPVTVSASTGKSCC